MFPQSMNFFCASLGAKSAIAGCVKRISLNSLQLLPRSIQLGFKKHETGGKEPTKYSVSRVFIVCVYVCVGGVYVCI